MRVVLAGAIALAISVAVPGVRAGGPCPGDGPLRVQAHLVDGRFVAMADAATGRVLASPAGDHALWGRGSGEVESVEPILDFAPRPDGFDLVAVYTNHHDKPRSPGVLYLPGIRFGQVVHSRDFYVDGKPRTIDHGGSTYFGGGNIYPGSIYSPIALIGDGDYFIGVSLLYPVLEYRHRAWIRIEAPDPAGIAGGQTWQVRCELNPGWRVGSQYFHSPEGDLAPGETRTYRLCVRVMRRCEGDHPQAWLRLFEPYRQWFSAVYGPVAYARDARPVLAVTIAYPEEIGPSNPYGFLGASVRPDVHGWGPWVARLEAHAAQGWERSMLWAPSGMFSIRREHNYPFQFTTGWQREPNTRDTLPLLADFAVSGPQLGLWWGHSANYMKEWDPAEKPILQPANPEHRAAVHAELDGAAAVGATMVGLDTFTRLNEWESIPYLAQLGRRYPGMRFLVEPMPSDVLHRVAAAYILATRPVRQISFQVENPHYLADFINPGHEIWGGVHEGDIKEQRGIPTDQTLPREALLTVLRRFAALGLVVAPFTGHPLGDDAQSVQAAQSWLDTVPGPLPVIEPPQVVGHPRGGDALPGDQVQLVVEAIGSQNTYRWRRDGVFLRNGHRIDGTDTAVLTIHPVMGRDQGWYDCVVTSALGEDQSNPAHVRVGCVTDFNGDGVANADDLSDYLLAYYGGYPPDPACDINRDGVVDADDLASFLNVIFYGC